MDRSTAIFVDGLGAAAATSGILNQLQGRIFALLYLQPRPVALEDIAAELEPSKRNVAVNIRGLVEWPRVRRTGVAGSRKDHYEAATDFWRVMQEIMERRFRWNLRQVLATAAETARAVGEERGPRRTERVFLERRLEALRAFFAAVDAASAPSPRENSSRPRRSRTCFASAHPVQGNGADRWNLPSSWDSSGSASGPSTSGSAPRPSAPGWSRRWASSASRPFSRSCRRPGSRRSCAPMPPIAGRVRRVSPLARSLPPPRSFFG